MRKLTPSTFLMGVMALGIAACGSDRSPVGPTDDPAEVIAVNGNGAVLDFEESVTLVVEVRNGQNAPVQGATVVFSSSGAEHTLSPPSATTGADGRASVTVTAGTEEGEVEVQATAGNADPAVFNLTVNGVPEGPAIVRVSGNGQTLASETESAPLVVEARDAEGTPVEGVTITFSGSGVAHTLSDETATTDGDGRAQITVTSGTEEGQIQVEASAEDYHPTTFTLTVDEGAAPISFEAPDLRPRGLAWDGENLWLVAAEDEEFPTIYKLDPSDGSVLDSFDAPGPGHRDLAWDGESLWYSSHGHRTIYQIDPSDGTVLNSFLSPRGDDSQPRGLAWDGENLWHSDAAGPERMIFRLSPEDGEVLDSFTSPVTLPVALEWDGTHLWTSQLSEPTNLVRFTTTGEIVSSIESPGEEAAVGLAFDADGPWMWTSDYSNGQDGVLIRRIPITLD